MKKFSALLLLVIVMIVIPSISWSYSFLHSTSARIINPRRGMIGGNLLLGEHIDFGLGFFGRYGFAPTVDGGVGLDIIDIGPTTVFNLTGDAKIGILSQKAKKPVDLSVDPFVNILFFEGGSGAIIGCKGLVSARYINVGSPQSWIEPMGGLMLGLYTGEVAGGDTELGIGVEFGLQYGINKHWVLMFDMGFSNQEPNFMIKLGPNYYF